MYCFDNSSPTLKNTIVTFNTPGGGLALNPVCDQGTCHPVITYCDFYGNTGWNYLNCTDPTGANGNLSVDPLFANAGAGDFRLKSQAGRWNGTSWVTDAVTSPCLNEGDPASAYADEPAPNGARINMGFDGNTIHASKTPPPVVVSATYVDATHVDLLFSEPLDPTTAATAANYVITPSRTVSTAVLQGGTNTVHLTTATSQAASTTYTVTVSNIREGGGVLISATGRTATWTTPNPAPTVVSATYVDATHVNVRFSEAMDATTVNTVGNYALSPYLTVTGSALQADTRTARLTTATQPASTIYTVTVSNVREVGGVPIGATGNSVTWRSPSPAPTVVSATYVDATHVNVLFSESMDATTAATAGNYVLAPSLTVSVAVLQADARTVRLTTASQPASTTHTVTVSNVKEAYGVLIGATDNTATWTTPNPVPTVVSATYVDPTHVSVLFSEAMDPPTANIAANYVLTPSVTVSAAVLQTDTRTVQLTTAAQAASTTYTVTVSGVKEAGGVAIGTSGKTATWTTPHPVPTVVSATRVDATHVNVLFSEAMDPSTAATADNYVIAPSLAVSSAVLQGDTKTVQLTTAAQTLDVTYTVAVSNVREVGGVLIGSTGNSASWLTPTAAVVAETGQGYPTIQVAIAAATTGQNVVVQPGTWHERIDFIGKAITVRSTDPGDPAVVAATTINGDAGGSVVTFNHSETALSALRGVTIRNGKSTNGAGVFCSAASPTLTNNIISGNKVTGSGGGVYCAASSSPVLTGNTISGNTGNNAGAGVACVSSSPTLTGNTISGNSTALWGVGVYSDSNSSPTLTGNTISANVGGSDGGGVSGCSMALIGNIISGNGAGDAGGVECSPCSTPAILTNNLISGNSATNGGGVVCTSCSPILTGNIIIGNTANTYFGGGIDFDHSSATLTNNVISGNSAATGGGGVMCSWSSPTLTNTTISGNSAPKGGGLYCTGTCSPILKNTIVAFSSNGAGLYLTLPPWSSTPVITYCDFYGNAGGNCANWTDPTGSNGNISADPLFADAGAGDFRLRSAAGRWNGTAWVNDAVTSPCIDAGDPAAAFSLEPALNGGRINMGYDGNTAYASRTVAPTVVSAAYVDTTHVNLLFSKTLNRSTAETLGSYAIASGPSAIPSRRQAARVTSRGIAGASKSKQPLGSKSAASVTSAALDADNRTVHLTTDVQAWSTTYTATVSGVTDTLGVAILTGSGDTASWTTPSPPPTVVSATYVDATHVNVLFSEAMDPTTADTAANYVPAPSVTVSAAVLQADAKTVWLTTAAQALSTSYTVTVTGVTEAGGVAIGSTGNTATWTTPNPPPTVVSATYVDATHVSVLFSEAMDATTAAAAANYVLAPSVAVSDAALQADSKTVLLTTATQAPSTTYTVTASGVTEAGGVPIGSTGNTATWTTPNPVPTVVSATYADATHLNVLFSEAMDSTTAATAANYVVAPSVAVSAAVLQADTRTVRLTTAAQALSTTYTVTVSNIKEAGGVAIGSTGNTATWTTPNPAPTVVSASYVDPTHVNVLFSEAMDATTAGTAANYAVAPSLAVSAAELQADTRTVLLTTAAQALSTNYTVTVSNVREVGGVVVGPTGNTATWTTPNPAPTVVSASYVDATHVNVLFDEAMDPTTVGTAANYAIAPSLAVSAAVLQADTRTVLLTTAAQAASTAYEVAVSNVREVGGVLLSASANRAGWTTPNPAPTVVRARYVGPTRVSVLLSEALDPTTAATAGNYTIAPSVAVTSAVLQADTQTVLLTTAAQVPSTNYTVTVSNVKAASGVPIGPTGNTATWTTPNPAPTVVSATYVDATHVSVLFSEALGAATAGTAANYAIAPSLTVSGAALQADTRTVLLTTAAQALSTSYTVTVSGVSEVGGVPDQAHRQHGDLDDAEPGADGGPGPLCGPRPRRCAAERGTGPDDGGDCRQLHDRAERSGDRRGAAGRCQDRAVDDCRPGGGHHLHADSRQRQGGRRGPDLVHSQHG